MRKVVLYIAASLDSYIAKLDGDTTWLHSPELVIPDEDYGYGALLASIDTTLMGNTTYENIMGFDIPFPYPDTTNYVFTRNQDREDTEFVQFVSTDMVTFVRSLRQEEGKDIWLIGGSQINTVLLENALIDEIILSIIPVTLGAGIPLFEKHKNFSKFEVKKCQAFESGLVQITYRFIPNK